MAPDNSYGQNGLTGRIPTNVLISILGALLVLLMGWLKTNVDAVSLKVDEMTKTLAGIAPTVAFFQNDLIAVHTAIGTMTVDIRHNADRVEELQREIDQINNAPKGQKR